MRLNMKDNKELGLNEIKLQFEREDGRKQSLESKASYILGIISLMATIILTIVVDVVFKSHFLFNFIYHIIIIALICLILFFIFFSAFFCIKILRIQNIYYPYNSLKPNEFKCYFSKNDIDLKEHLFDSYLSSTFLNNLRNNKKAEYINKSFCFLIFGIVFLIVLILIILMVSVW